MLLIFVWFLEYKVVCRDYGKGLSLYGSVEVDFLINCGFFFLKKKIKMLGDEFYVY